MEDAELFGGIKTYLELGDDPNSNLLNALSHIKKYVGDGAWVGFYIFSPARNYLYLGPFQGTPACVRINPEHGVVGACFSKKEDIYVPDVREFPGYIACDEAARSEACYYFEKDGIGLVFDIDSVELDGLSDKFDSLRKAGEMLFGFIPASRLP
ncbi:MAG: hypothetical protein Q4F15_04085 [Bacillota bacterium]|nr:hypothetical protein [Bacillota bacterium]